MVHVEIFGCTAESRKELLLEVSNLLGNHQSFDNGAVYTVHFQSTTFTASLGHRKTLRVVGTNKAELDAAISRLRSLGLAIEVLPIIQYITPGYSSAEE